MEKIGIKDVIASKSGRLKEVRVALNLTQKQFATLLNIDASNITKYELGKIPIGRSIEYRLFAEVRNLNQLWWETGDGRMFNEGVLWTGEPTAPHKDIKCVPYYDIDVSAGEFTFFSLEATETPTALLEVPFFVDCEFAVRVYGNSMVAKFMPGDVIFCKEVSHFREFVSYGEPYLVIYGDGERRVKYLKRSVKEGCYRLSSENAHYEDYDVPIALIQRVFLVKGKLEKMSM